MAVGELPNTAPSGSGERAGEATVQPPAPDEPPQESVTHVVVASPSRSADAGHLSTADIVTIARDADIEFRLVGGNAISLLVWVHGASDLVPERERPTTQT